MNREDAKTLSQIVTISDIQQMFQNAAIGVKDWRATSTVNMGCTKGSAWNILRKVNPENDTHSRLGTQNAIREFGEFLPDTILSKLPSRIKKTPPAYVHHEDPIFDNIISPLTP